MGLLYYTSSIRGHFSPFPLKLIQLHELHLFGWNKEKKSHILWMRSAHVHWLQHKSNAFTLTEQTNEMDKINWRYIRSCIIFQTQCFVKKITKQKTEIEMNMVNVKSAPFSFSSTHNWPSFVSTGAFPLFWIYANYNVLHWNPAILNT